MLVRATVVSFDAVNHVASVRVDGSAPQVLSGVKTARNIASAEMAAGRRVVLDTGDHGDAGDAVVIAVYQ